MITEVQAGVRFRTGGGSAALARLVLRFQSIATISRPFAEGVPEPEPEQREAKDGEGKV